MVKNFDPSCKTLLSLHKKYIHQTKSKEIVLEKTIFLCGLTHTVQKGIDLDSYRVYVTSKAVKHLYDKKPAVTYDFIVQKVHLAVKYPDRIYLNKQGKRGNYLFVKQISDNNLLVSLELSDENEIYLVTAFPVEEKYLKKCVLIWSWRVGTPSS